jgi:hypothetical protein
MLIAACQWEGRVAGKESCTDDNSSDAALMDLSKWRCKFLSKIIGQKARKQNGGRRVKLAWARPTASENEGDFY